VEAAAIQVGSVLAFSNSRGEFSVRVKNRNAVDILLLPAVFATPCDWKVVKAPADVMPGQSVEIVVCRDVR
jgi:hypothetical protein